VEPIALYHTKDLYEPRDNGWLSPYPAQDQAAPMGSARIYHEDATDLAILTYGNGVLLSLRAARSLREEHGERARVVDLRWLNPLNEELILDQATRCGRVLVVDEGRRSGGVNEAILAVLAEQAGSSVQVRRITGADSYVPLGPAASLVLPSEEEIVKMAVSLAST
jgi:2-oxoisovalerate dehydrogenase E1 component